MPGMYAAGDYDLAGFCVGIVDKDNIIDGEQTRAGDVLIALPSSGPHSNGYSLIRKLLERAQATPATQLGTGLLYDALLAPTRIYVKSVLALMQQVPVHGVAHITGGGLLENIPRVVPEGLEVVIDRNSWTLPPVFQWLQQVGHIDEHEMLRTFNCGVGMTICVAPQNLDKALQVLATLNEPAFVIGQVRAGNGGVVVQH
jgi:phosphoribosylformylglycinamidine cyclo-ligase